MVAKKKDGEVVKVPLRPDKVDAIADLLLGLEDVLVASAPEQEKVRELYARLKEARQ